MNQTVTTLLIVDDNPDDRLTFKRYLNRYESVYQIIEASSASEGLELVKTFDIDGILLDFRLPDEDGLEFIQQLKQHNNPFSCPIIMLTGVGNQSVAVEAMKNGVHDYLVKSDITPDNLHKAIQNSLEKFRLRRELAQSEQRFRATFEQAAVGIAHLGLDNRLLRFNQRFQKIVGYSQHYLQDKTCIDIIHPEDRQYYQENFQQLLTYQTLTFSQEKRYLRPDNSPIWVNVTLSIVRQDSGEPDYIISVVEDINTRKQTEAALKQANEHLHALVAQLQQQNQERILLSELNTYLQTCTSVKEAYCILADLIHPLFPGFDVGVCRIDESGTEVKLVSHWGKTFVNHPRFLAQECWALRLNRVHWSNNSQGSLLCPHCHDYTPSIACCVCIPILVQGKPLGLIILSNSQPGQLSQEKQQLAQILSEQIVLALANLQLQEKLQTQSSPDPLSLL
ncbi:putative PAS/PAC sensor protein [Gloeothece citriformis PCC 7424]|uniref:Putative PAS/PAC sensor protein n=1 Tax=Gloeothece citriformis (strain PCC 7424) TaxID=65393 RepID=B7KIT5_GLOC7|nr:PAS domain S-box protein [Gloeothece citriformis]ACK70771.1 putative PAS/PAC sensor protein [Gloeothece citriformis PCC 7424]